MEPAVDVVVIGGGLAGLTAARELGAFAGSDIARGWGSYLDGAIETGLRAGREIEAILP
jgi:monoamine oxidase